MCGTVIIYDPSGVYFVVGPKEIRHLLRLFVVIIYLRKFRIIALQIRR